MGKELLNDLEQGTTFAYKNNYYIVDDSYLAVQITGRNAGTAGVNVDNVLVRPVSLLVEEY